MNEKKELVEFARPVALKRGDTVAAISLSWGGPNEFKQRYEFGKKVLQREFGLVVKETKYALRSPEWLSRNPQARADDLHECLEDKSIKGIFSTIGGEDSIKLIPFLDISLIARAPKIFLGYSDSTVTHRAFNIAKVVSFYGPSIMAGFAENGGMFEYTKTALNQTIFGDDSNLEVRESPHGWTAEENHWEDPNKYEIRRRLQKPKEWVFSMPAGQVSFSGKLIGGCVQVLTWLEDSVFCLKDSDCDGAILALETCEEKDNSELEKVCVFLKAAASRGLLQRLNGILFGRPGGARSQVDVDRHDQAVLDLLRERLDLSNLPIVSSMDFGHTDPMGVLPLGLEVEVDSISRGLRWLKSPTVATHS